MVKILLLLVGLGFFSSCEKDEHYRSYREIFIRDDKNSTNLSHNNSTSNPQDSGINPTHINLKWDKPAGWHESHTSGIPLAAFQIREGPKGAECSIISLPDSGGGLTKNIHKWMKQLRILIPPDNQFKRFLRKQTTFKTKSGAGGILIDLTQLLSGDLTSDQSIISAVIAFKNHTVLIKMGGDINVIISNKVKLLSLSRSIEIINEL